LEIIHHFILYNRPQLLYISKYGFFQFHNRGGKTVNIVREEAKKILDKLPDEASWDDLMYEIYVSKKIEQGIKDADEGKVISNEEAKKRLLKK